MRRVLITAGATRNPVDEMRYISAFSSGRTGRDIAAALGAGVDLLGSPEACLRAGVGQEFGSTTDLMNQMESWVRAHPLGIVVHAAAVGDYQVAKAIGKIPSGQDMLTLQLVPTPKIVDRINGWSPTVTLISFKAAPPDTTDEMLVTLAHQQRVRTQSAMVFANVLGSLHQNVCLVSETGETWHPQRSDALLDLVERIEVLRSS